VGQSRQLIFICFIAATLSSVVGCQSGKSEQAEAEKRANEQVAELRKRAHWDEQPTGVKQEPVLVKQGPAPLAHLFDVGGAVRVMDLTTKAQLAAQTVPGRTLVRVDAAKGVTINQDNVSPGPLPDDHTYGIFLDPSTDNVMRQGVGPAKVFQP
jgi:hypothetical protein